MVAVTRSCWCGADVLESFGEGYLRCPRCTTLVGQVGLTAEEAVVHDDDADFYGRRYWLEHQRDELGLPDVHARVRRDLVDRCGVWLEALVRYRPPPGRVLEVGAGPGAYTALLGWAGYDTTAVDLSDWTGALARERFGVAYLVGPIESHELEPVSFDVVIANDVLEHLVDPVGTVGRCAALLKPGGLLVLQTPEYPHPRSFAQLEAEQDPFLEHMRLPAHEHLHLFSRGALRRLLERAGFTHVAFEEPPFPYDMLAVAGTDVLRRRENVETVLQSGGSAVWPLVLALLDATAELRRSEHDRAERLRVIERLDELLRVSEEDRQARLEKIERLDELLRKSEHDRQAQLRGA
jgi:2-polyprenyl-3-methyl-5-hydroxy-6-metoxy-1,4-benzoquinol methylase